VGERGSWWVERQFNKATKEIIVIIIVMIIIIIMNMQSKLFRIQFFSPFGDRCAARRKFKLLAERGFKLPENQKADNSTSPWPAPSINRARHPWCGAFPLAGSAVCLVARPPGHGKLGKGLDWW